MVVSSPAASRQEISLNGSWQFQRNGAAPESWKEVAVPSSFESHEGIEFNGVGWYRKTIPPFALAKGQRVLLHFEAAATEATVWWNGHRLGSHLGAWTPFRFDVTDLVRAAAPNRPHELRVRLDEKVGHNTQGFLPIIAPHFGGLWQGVQLVLVPDTYVDDLRLQAYGDWANKRLKLALALAGNTSVEIRELRVRYRLRGQADYQELTAPLQRDQDDAHLLRAEIPVRDPQRWSPANPLLYELQLALPGTNGDAVSTRAAFRTIDVQGDQFRLNGNALGIRGVLNWGYSPPLTAPNPGEETWRQELEFARSYGFNLMKFCLWIPPQRYLELADELGVLTWMEYPTWHPQLTEKFRGPLQREFQEFFYYDRNHPSVILRSLTCETGPGAELPVIQRLYDLAHAMIPGAVVEDDSSWIGWNRVNDFYDDHPYGNNHTWVPTLHRLNDYVRSHGVKPLVLGEAIAADTWVDRAPLLQRLGDDRPFWAPGPLDEQARWLERMRSVTGPEGLDRLGPDSLRYALLMRKYQIETYRREVPHGGYVVSVIRDIPNASMGLIDYNDQPKWPATDWSWQRETICLLKTPNDCRSFLGGGRLQAELWLSHFGNDDLRDAELTVELVESEHTDKSLSTIE